MRYIKSEIEINGTSRWAIYMPEANRYLYYSSSEAVIDSILPRLESGAAFAGETPPNFFFNGKARQLNDA